MWPNATEHELNGTGLSSLMVVPSTTPVMHPGPAPGYNNQTNQTGRWRTWCSPLCTYHSVSLLVEHWWLLLLVLLSSVLVLVALCALMWHLRRVIRRLKHPSDYDQDEPLPSTSAMYNEPRASTPPPPQSRPSISSRTDTMSKRNLMTRMIARLDEFDSLTPLMITPGSISDEEPLMTYAPSISSGCSTPAGQCVPKQWLHQYRAQYNNNNDSPPPVRRSINGKTCIAPLTRASRATPAPGTEPIRTYTAKRDVPAYHYSSMMSTGWKQIGTIHEVTEESTQGTDSGDLIGPPPSATVFTNTNAARDRLIDFTWNAGTSNRGYECSNTESTTRPLAAAVTAVAENQSKTSTKLTTTLPQSPARPSDLRLVKCKSDKETAVVGVSTQGDQLPSPIEPCRSSSSSSSSSCSRNSRASSSLESVSSPMSSTSADSHCDTTNSLGDVCDSLYGSERPPGRSYYIDAGSAPFLQAFDNNNSQSECSSSAAGETILNTESVTLAGYSATDIDFPSTRRFQLHRIIEEDLSEPEKDTDLNQGTKTRTVLDKTGNLALKANKR